MRRDREPSRADHSTCYGQGCVGCGMRGWVETDAGREAREEAEDRRADEGRHEPWERPSVRHLEAGSAEGGPGWFPDAGVGPGS